MPCSFDPSHPISPTARSDARFCSDACRAAYRRQRVAVTISLAVDALRGGNLSTAEALLAPLVVASRPTRGRRA